MIDFNSVYKIKNPTNQLNPFNLNSSFGKNPGMFRGKLIKTDNDEHWLSVNWPHERSHRHTVHQESIHSASLFPHFVVTAVTTRFRVRP